ncbi:MAG: hypothetical protein JWO76_54 [Nocardioides sp.]|nr:hypothetical protein [Nocardioides sp.]
MVNQEGTLHLLNMVNQEAPGLDTRRRVRSRGPGRLLDHHHRVRWRGPDQLNSLLRIFPVAVIGSDGTISTERGYL